MRRYLITLAARRFDGGSQNMTFDYVSQAPFRSSRDLEPVVRNFVARFPEITSAAVLSFSAYETEQGV